MNLAAKQEDFMAEIINLTIEQIWRCNKCNKKGLAKNGIPKICPNCQSRQIWHPRTDIFAKMHAENNRTPVPGRI
jgi:rubrerythrin